MGEVKNTPRDFSRGANLPPYYLSHVITVTSMTGAGSSSTLRALKEYLKGSAWQFASGGGIMREFAASIGMTIEEFSAHNLLNPNDGWDLKCDHELSARGRQNFTVIESRLSHAFVPHAYHVLLECDLAIRVSRRFNDLQKVTPNITSVDVAQMIEQRDHDDNERFEQLYPGCLWGSSDFNLVIDTGTHNPTDVAKLIMRRHEMWGRDNVNKL